jgi:cellulose synthase/poly-beta-1,6-N-acetylglucosamine synthase-like glycosyltransferase
MRSAELNTIGRSMSAPLWLSVVIPAHNEAGVVDEAVTMLASTLTAERIPHEILVVDDASSDGTGAVVNEVSASNPSARCVRSHLPPKLRLREMGSRYVFIVLYVFLEHHLSRGDYRRSGLATAGRLRLHAGARAPDMLEGSQQWRHTALASRLPARVSG